MSRASGYGRSVLEMLKAAEAGDGLTPREAASLARWVKASLTDAALDGCHHCGERRDGEPCWWCGLKTESEPVVAQ